jgi:hypothetical protein
VREQLSSTAGIPPIITVETPGVHGDAVAGIQAPGVCTPKAADVAAIVVGLAVALHMPKDMMLTKGA